MDKKELEHVFNMEDYAKDLLFNSVTEKQQKRARSLLNKIKEVYIPIAIEDI